MTESELAYQKMRAKGLSHFEAIETLEMFDELARMWNAGELSNEVRAALAVGMNRGKN